VKIRVVDSKTITAICAISLYASRILLRGILIQWSSGWRVQLVDWRCVVRKYKYDWRARGDLCSQCTMRRCPQDVYPPRTCESCESHDPMTHGFWKGYFDMVLRQEQWEKDVPYGVRGLGRVEDSSTFRLYASNILLTTELLGLVGREYCLFVDELVSLCKVHGRMITVKVDSGPCRCDGRAVMYSKVGYCNPCEILLRAAICVDGPRLRWIMAHEMVHHEQYYSGRLKYDGGRAVWLGKHMPHVLPHDDRPWEIEANKRADALVKEVDVAEQVA